VAEAKIGAEDVTLELLTSYVRGAYLTLRVAIAPLRWRLNATTVERCHEIWVALPFTSKTWSLARPSLRTLSDQTTPMNRRPRERSSKRCGLSRLQEMSHVDR